MLERLFRLSDHGTTARTEVLAGLTTFLTMAYIVFVQPAVLSTDFAGRPTGLDFNAVLVATALASAFASILMGLYAGYPIALAPGMGENFFFVSVVMSLGALGVAAPWQTALGMVFLSGVAFIVMTLLRVREAVIDAISPSFRSGIAVGIGIFIAFIGLRSGGLIVAKSGTIVGLNANLVSADTGVFAVGLLTAAVLGARRVRGALVWGILASAVLAVALGKVRIEGVFGLPEITTRAAFALDIPGALRPELAPFVVVFLFMGLFDTVGTLVGVAEQANLLEQGRLPRAGRALLVDATGITAGACLGTSTVTCYIESAAGVAAGGRTGMTSVVAGLLFLVALVFSPLVGVIGRYPPIAAPALVVVGSMMMRQAVKVEWDDASEAVPAFLTMAAIPLSYSIADGLAIGFAAYPAVKILSGRWRDLRWLSVVMAILLVLYFVFVRTRLA